MLPACRIAGEGFAIPSFDVVPRDVEGFLEELWAFQSVFHDCFARSEPRTHLSAWRHWSQGNERGAVVSGILGGLQYTVDRVSA